MKADEPTPSELENEAAAWAARLDRAPEEVRSAAFTTWSSADPRAAGALLRAQAALALFDPPVAHKAANQGHSADRMSRRRLFASAGGLLAASIVAVALITRQQAIETDVGEIRSLTLSDGSAATLDTQTHVRLALSDAERNINLTKGKAFFQVAHDPKRPFRVMAGDMSVTAIGTAFQVTVDENGGGSVVMSEGIVAVSYPGGTIRLSGGQRADIPYRGPARVSEIDRNAIERSLAWREGRLDLAGEPLSVAVAEMNRHGRRPIVITDPALEREALYGVFQTNDPASFAAAVGATVNAPVRAEDGRILIGKF